MPLFICLGLGIKVWMFQCYVPDRRSLVHQAASLKEVVSLNLFFCFGLALPKGLQINVDQGALSLVNK